MMKTNYIVNTVIITLGLLLVLSSCKKNDDNNDNNPNIHVESMDDLVADEFFEFNTTDEIELEITALDNGNGPIAMATVCL